MLLLFPSFPEDGGGIDVGPSLPSTDNFSSLSSLLAPSLLLLTTPLLTTSVVVVGVLVAGTAGEASMADAGAEVVNTDNEVEEEEEVACSRANAEVRNLTIPAEASLIAVPVAAAMELATSSSESVED
jgi:hypothetical protein